MPVVRKVGGGGRVTARLHSDKMGGLKALLEVQNSKLSYSKFSCLKIDHLLPMTVFAFISIYTKLSIDSFITKIDMYVIKSKGNFTDQ